MIKLTVPATTTNFGSGFDAFGLALSLRNTFWVEFSDDFQVEVKGFSSGIPTDERNLFIKVYRRTCQVLGLKETPIHLIQENRVPPARGLGSSATAIVGGIEASLLLHGKELSLEDKLRIAYEFESHPDNLLPAFVGGFTVCATDGKSLSYLKLSFPRELRLVFAVPSYELSTQEARKVLPRELSLPDAVYNLQRSALFVASLLTGRYELLGEATKDRIHQPYRARLIPGFEEALRGAYEAGALAVFLSGAGPSLCAIVRDGEEEVGRAMRESLERASGREVEVLRLEAEERGVIAYS